MRKYFEQTLFNRESICSSLTLPVACPGFDLYMEKQTNKTKTKKIFNVLSLQGNTH